MGRPTEVSIEDVVECFNHEPMFAREVAAELRCSRRTALEKLDLAESHGELHSKKSHRGCRVFWR